jgi:prevent-host-death family protein
MTSSAPQAEHGEVPAPGLAVQAAAVHDTVELSRLVLGVAAAGGADARTLARDARLPGWLLGVDRAMIGSAQHGRLWELAAHALQDPYLGLTAVARHQVGDLDLYDYLFTTAGTVREALEVSGDLFHLVSTNCSLEAQPQPGGEITYLYRHALPGGLGEELWTQFSIAGFCARISAATGRPVVPAHVAFAQPPPRSHRAFTETFGTRSIDFGASVTTFTLRASDLDRPMPGADPALAAILRRYAATLPRPQPVDWLGRFRQVLAETMGEGTISVNALARRLAVSTRTLQRRLAEHGTTWRAELEAARLRRVQLASTAGPASGTLLARQLGYADPRSVRRALRRWGGLTSSSGTVAGSLGEEPRSVLLLDALSRTDRGASYRKRQRLPPGRVLSDRVHHRPERPACCGDARHVQFLVRKDGSGTKGGGAVRSMTYSESRAHYAETLNAVVDDREEVIITRAGHEPVVIVALSEYESLKETAYLLRSPENARRLLASIDRLEHGGGIERDLME